MEFGLKLKEEGKDEKEKSEVKNMFQ